MIYMKEQCNFCITSMDVFYGNNINPVSCHYVSVFCSIHTLKGSCVCHVACVLETSKPSLSACSQRTCPISAQRQSVKVSREPQLKQRIPLCPRDEDKSMFRWPQWHGLAEKQQGCVTSHKLVCSCHIKLSGTYESQKKRIWFVLEFFLHSFGQIVSFACLFFHHGPQFLYWRHFPLLRFIQFIFSLWERKMNLHLCVTKRYLTCFITWYNIVIPSVLCDLAVS